MNNKKKRQINYTFASNQFREMLSRCAPHNGLQYNFNSTWFEKCVNDDVHKEKNDEEKTEKFCSL